MVWHSKYGYWSNIINWLEYFLSMLINLSLGLSEWHERRWEICLPSVLSFIVSYVLPEDSSRGSFDSESPSWSVGGECTPGDGCPSVKYPLIAIAASVDCRVLKYCWQINTAFGLATTCVHVKSRHRLALCYRKCYWFRIILIPPALKRNISFKPIFLKWNLLGRSSWRERTCYVARLRYCTFRTAFDSIEWF